VHKPPQQRAGARIFQHQIGPVVIQAPLAAAGIGHLIQPPERIIAQANSAAARDRADHAVFGIVGVGLAAIGGEVVVAVGGVELSIVSMDLLQTARSTFDTISNDLLP
jgi:hypothetical protein